jgi:hypothetical protein
VISNGQRSPDDASITLSRVGFDQLGTTAVVIFAYRQAGPPGSCGKVAAAFLTRHDGNWEVDSYSVEKSW